MSTNTPTPLQQAIGEIAQVGEIAAAPFIHSTAGQGTESKVVGEVNLGIAALPLLGDLFHLIGNLFHHTHKAVAAMTSTPASGS